MKRIVATLMLLAVFSGLGSEIKANYYYYNGNYATIKYQDNYFEVSTYGRFRYSGAHVYVRANNGLVREGWVPYGYYMTVYAQDYYGANGRYHAHSATGSN